MLQKQKIYDAFVRAHREYDNERFIIAICDCDDANSFFIETKNEIVELHNCDFDTSQNAFQRIAIKHRDMFHDLFVIEYDETKNVFHVYEKYDDKLSKFASYEFRDDENDICEMFVEMFDDVCSQFRCDDDDCDDCDDDDFCDDENDDDENDD